MGPGQKGGGAWMGAWPAEGRAAGGVAEKWANRGGVWRRAWSESGRGFGGVGRGWGVVWLGEARGRGHKGAWSDLGGI